MFVSTQIEHLFAMSHIFPYDMEKVGEEQL